jgi:hypothetical protein|tara:strand:+ start:228 stop:1046 length:819 start_codon:yes stop_codon:yes gene_type:complete
MKHNKKRNIAFIYEALSRELTRAIVDKNSKNKKTIMLIMKEHFGKNSILLEELRLYRALLETKRIKREIAERLLAETKQVHSRLNTKELFDAQSDIIASINKEVGPQVWSNFIPNFKSIASISAIFNSKTPVKKKVLFEQSVIDGMSQSDEDPHLDMRPVDNIVYGTFIDKFNKKYSNLREEQKELLNHYITSFADEGCQLKVYLNEELGRLKDSLKGNINIEEEDAFLAERVEEVQNYLESFRRREFTDADLSKLLKTQELVQEISTDDKN